MRQSLVRDTPKAQGAGSYNISAGIGRRPVAFGMSPTARTANLPEGVGRRQFALGLATAPLYLGHLAAESCKLRKGLSECGGICSTYQGGGPRFPF